MVLAIIPDPDWGEPRRKNVEQPYLSPLQMLERERAALAGIGPTEHLAGGAYELNKAIQNLRGHPLNDNARYRLDSLEDVDLQHPERWLERTTHVIATNYRDLKRSTRGNEEAQRELEEIKIMIKENSQYLHSLNAKVAEMEKQERKSKRKEGVRRFVNWSLGTTFAVTTYLSSTDIPPESLRGPLTIAAGASLAGLGVSYLLTDREDIEHISQDSQRSVKKALRKAGKYVSRPFAEAGRTLKYKANRMALNTTELILLLPQYMAGRKER